MSAITTGFTDGILADKAVVELKIARLFFNLAKPSKVVNSNLGSPSAGGRTEGRGIRSQVT